MWLKMTEKYNQDETINENWLAEEITDKEGKKVQVNIGQVKEVLKIALDLLAKEFSLDEIEGLLQKHR